MEYKFKVTYTRGSGPGGQRKNKVETKVVVIHEESGFQETCQDTPSRARNLSIAKWRLIKRLNDREREMEAQRKNELRVKVMDGAMVVKTYDYKRGVVKDHRTGKEAPLKEILKGKLNLLR